MIDHGDEQDAVIFEWAVEESGHEPVAPVWRRPLLMGVAALTAIALALVPLYEVLSSSTPTDNGLAVCGFDYCIVQDGVTDAGLDGKMSRLSNTYLDEAEAAAFARQLTSQLGIAPVELRVVERLQGRLGGFYDPATRSIQIESPARAWTVLHEVAHAVETDHAEGFRRVVIELARMADTPG